ncbi:polyphosphate polymerase domain-containing protein [uncultured Serinicoccus sp.]|uniref:polyphosphate polymerase domain-containing protein n=1 Tax=uncultured Serinicoccus sp. TaxID=735514 RepID=UPI00261A66D6|nr:polyphosphate polymerase domain-containing protein [uncultured Serinicoccus sp.]
MSAVNALRPVTLAELTERAALMSRTDRKYLVPSSLVDYLVGTLADTDADAVQVLQIGDRREFGYRSTYLDTPDLDCYRAAATGRRRRSKVRVRTYLDTGDSYLEVKTRGMRGVAVKERLLRDGATVTSEPALTAAELAFVAERLTVGTSATAGLHPTLVTTYRRTTLLDAVDGARVTLDTGLSWTLPQSEPAHRWTGLDDLVVVETKTDSRPGRADRLLWAAGIRPVRLSKYATGMALTHALTGNRWHRTTARLRADLHRTTSLALAG